MAELFESLFRVQTRILDELMKLTEQALWHLALPGMVIKRSRLEVLVPFSSVAGFKTARGRSIPRLFQPRGVP
jgi:hypothetical protein